MDSTLIVVDARPDDGRYAVVTSMEYVHRVVVVSSWAAALTDLSFPPRAVVLADVGRNERIVASIVRTCRSLGCRVVCDTGRASAPVVREALAAGAVAWDGSPEGVPAAFGD